MLKTKRLLSVVLAVLMCVSMFTGIILPASAGTETKTDPYAKITGTEAGGVITPAQAVYFVNTEWSSKTSGEEFDYTYGNGTTWGNGKTYHLTFGTNAFDTYLNMQAAVQDYSATWAADTANNTRDVVVVFAPGQQSSVTSPDSGIGAYSNMTPAATENVGKEDLINIYMLGPQAGKSPVADNYMDSQEAAAKVANNRSTSTSTEFVFKSTTYIFTHANSYWDGFAFTTGAKLYEANFPYASFYATNLYVSDLTAPSGNQFWAGGGASRQFVFHVTDSYLNWNKAIPNESSQDIYGNDILIEGCVFAGGAMSTTHKYNQPWHMKFYPSNAAYATEDFYGDKATAPSIIFRNNAVPSWESCHFLRFVVSNAAFTSYTNYAINVTVEGNHFYDVGKYTATSDMFYIDKITTDDMAKSWTFTVQDNLFSFSEAWDTVKNQSSIGSVFNGNEGTATAAYQWNIVNNTFIMNPHKNHIVYYQVKKGVDASGNLHLDTDNNVIPSRAHGSGYQSNYTNSGYPYSDTYASDEWVGGMREMFTVREVTNGVACYSMVQLGVRGNKTTPNYFDGVITVLLKRNDDGTCINYDADTLLKFNDPDVKFEGIYEEEACTNRVTTVTQDTVDGMFAKATYTAGNTKATVIFMLTVPTTYLIVDPEGDYGTTGYKFNGVTYKPGETAVDGVTAPAATIRGDGTTGFFQYIDNSHSDVSSENKDYCAYGNTADPTLYDWRAAAGSTQRYNALTTLVVLTPGTYDFANQGMGKSVCFVGPQFGVSPFDNDLAKQGKLANGRSADPTKEAVLYGTLNPTGVASFNYVFDGITFAGTRAALNFSANGNLVGSQWQTIVVKNCLFTNSGASIIYGSNERDKGTKQLDLTINDCVVDATDIDRDGADSLIGARSNMFTMKNFAVLNDNTGAMAGTEQHRLTYLGWTNPKFIKVYKKRNFADFENVVLYNSNRNITLFALRPASSWDCDFEHFPGGAELNIKNCTAIGGYGYFFGAQSPQPGQNGDDNFIKLTATGNYFKRTDYSGYVIENYQDWDYRNVNAFTDDSVIENNVFYTKTPYVGFKAYYKENISVDKNYFGDASSANYHGYVADPQVGSFDSVANIGVTHNLYTYYINEDLTAKNTDVQLQDNGYTSISHDYFLGYNRTNIEAATAAPAVNTFFKVPAGAEILGVYSDAELNTPVTGNINKSATLYVNVKHTATGATCVTEAKVTIPCAHAGERTAATRVEATCGTDGYQQYTCDDCGAVVDAWTVTLPATQAHTWNNGEVSIEPTCQVKGTTLYTCTNENCLPDGTKATKTEQDIPVVPCESDGTWNVVTAPKCEVDGSETQNCKWCDAVLATQAIPQIGHDWDEGVEDPVHNCLSDGVMTYTCKNDSSHTYTQEVPSTGEHNFVGTVITPATCTTPGIIEYKCDGCGTSHQEAIPVTGHNYVATTTKEPTCVEDGILTYTCQNAGCNDSYTTPAPANGSHDYKAEVTKYPTCTEDGVMTYTCQRANCGAVTSEVIPNKGGHQFGNWILRKPATCTVPGVEYRICIECEEEETRDTALIDHVYDTEFTIDIQPTGTVKGEKSRHCLICKDARIDITDLGYCEHTNTTGEWIIDRETSCKAAGEKHQICADCGDNCNITEIPALPHQYIETNINVAATCTTNGERELTCTVCNNKTTEVIDATGHNPGAWRTTTEPTCTAPGEATQYCSTCNAPLATRTVDAKGHGTYTWITTTPADCVNAGIASYTCGDCGAVSDTKAIPAKGHSAVHIDTIPATCTETGLRDYECAVCGQSDIDVVIPATGHTAGKWETVTPATTLSYGVKVKYCTVCGEEVERAIIEQIVCSGNPFKDVASNAWYKKAVNFVYCSGLMNGTSATTFSPNVSTTRGMFVTILGRLSGINADQYTNAYFEDVKDGSYYFGYIEWARVNGIIQGTGNYVFEPDRAITRQEMCKMIISYADYEEITLQYKNSKTTFKDDAKIAKWAKTYVYACQRAGIVSGDTSGSFRPTDTANRAEIATLIMNFYVNCMK